MYNMLWYHQDLLCPLWFFCPSCFFIYAHRTHNFPLLYEMTPSESEVIAYIYSSSDTALHNRASTVMCKERESVRTFALHVLLCFPDSMTTCLVCFTVSDKDALEYSILTLTIYMKTMAHTPKDAFSTPIGEK